MAANSHDLTPLIRSGHLTLEGAVAILAMREDGRYDDTAAFVCGQIAALRQAAQDKAAETA